jgi:hypothetical protein
MINKSKSNIFRKYKILNNSKESNKEKTNNRENSNKKRTLIVIKTVKLVLKYLL